MGDLKEVIISPRRDKRGRKYGFARFRNVGDEKMLAVKLDNLVLEGRKLFANIPRFQRPSGEGFKKSVQFHKAEGKKPINDARKEDFYKKGGIDIRSFKDVTMQRQACGSASRLVKKSLRFSP